MKEIIEYTFLGLLQGITEPLPISSSGHLVLATDLFGSRRENINLEIILNFGSLIAVLLFYREDIKRLFINNFNFVFRSHAEHKGDFIYVMFLILATIPVAIAGAVAKSWIEQHMLNSLVVGVALWATGVSLLAVNKLGAENKRINISLKDSLIIGLCQVIAIIPGISRSGSTLVGGLLRGISSDSVLKFSFLLYIPVSVGSMILALRDINIGNSNLSAYFLGFSISIISTYFSLMVLYRVVKRSSLHYFAIYCFAIGALGIWVGI